MALFFLDDDDTETGSPSATGFDDIWGGAMGVHIADVRNGSSPAIFRDRDTAPPCDDWCLPSWSCASAKREARPNGCKESEKSGETRVRPELATRPRPKAHCSGVEGHTGRQFGRAPADIASTTSTPRHAASPSASNAPRPPKDLPVASETVPSEENPPHQYGTCFLANLANFPPPNGQISRAGAESIHAPATPHPGLKTRT